jgi:hypothetical protein
VLHCFPQPFGKLCDGPDCFGRTGLNAKVPSLALASRWTWLYAIVDLGLSVHLASRIAGKTSESPGWFPGDCPFVAHGDKQASRVPYAIKTVEACRIEGRL